MHYAILVIQKATRVNVAAHRWVQHGKSTQCQSCVSRLYEHYTKTLGRSVHETRTISYTDIADKHMQIDTLNDDLTAYGSNKDST
jgi:hypothetical protein